MASRNNSQILVSTGYTLSLSRERYYGALIFQWLVDLVNLISLLTLHICLLYVIDCS